MLDPANIEAHSAVPLMLAMPGVSEDILTTPTIASTLPEDVLLHILQIDELMMHSRTLEACTYVCRGWKEAAQKALFTTQRTGLYIGRRRPPSSPHLRRLGAVVKQLKLSTGDSSSSALFYANIIQYDLDLRNLFHPSIGYRPTLPKLLTPITGRFLNLTDLYLTSTPTLLDSDGCTCIRSPSIQHRKTPLALRGIDMSLTQGFANVHTLTLDEIELFPDLLSLAFFICSFSGLKKLRLRHVDWLADGFDDEAQLPRDLRITALEIRRISACKTHGPSSLDAIYWWILRTKAAATLEQLVVNKGTVAPTSDQMLQFTQRGRSKELCFHGRLYNATDVQVPVGWNVGPRLTTLRIDLYYAEQSRYPSSRLYRFCDNIAGAVGVHTICVSIIPSSKSVVPKTYHFDDWLLIGEQKPFPALKRLKVTVPRQIELFWNAGALLEYFRLDKLDQIEWITFEPGPFVAEVKLERSPYRPIRGYWI